MLSYTSIPSAGSLKGKVMFSAGEKRLQQDFGLKFYHTRTASRFPSANDFVPHELGKVRKLGIR